MSEMKTCNQSIGGYHERILHCFGFPSGWSGLARGKENARDIFFDALPQAFWYMVQIPDALEALKIQVDFFDRHLGS